MVSRLKLPMRVVREMMQHGRKYHGCSDNSGFRSSFPLKRLSKNNLREGSSISTREKRRPALAYGAHKHFQSGKYLKGAVASLISRVYQGTAIDSHSFIDVLQGCSKRKDLELVQQVHDCVKKSGLEQNTYVANGLMKCYIRCGRLQNAQELFNKLLNKDTASWTIMIGGLAESDQPDNAITIYKRLRDEGGEPDIVTYLSALKACSSPGALDWGKDIHAHIRNDGIQADGRVGTALLHMYAKCGSIQEARAVFNKMKSRDVASWNAMIGGLAHHELGPEALSLFHQMKREGVLPNAVTYLSILSLNYYEGALEWVKEIYTHAARSGLDADLRVGNAFVHMYAKSGSIEDARAVFDRMEKHDVISWNVMIGGLAQHGLGHEAFSLFLKMQREGFIPDPITCMNILNPSSSIGALEWVKEVHAHAMKVGFEGDLRLMNSFVHMYAKIGSIGDARLVFDNMLERNEVSWNMMIGGLAEHGHGREALQYFEDMKLRGFKPSRLSFLAVLSACSHAGLVDEGRLQFLSMVREYDIKPTLEHCNCLIDMLGRSGNLEEAKLCVLNMPIKPDKVTLMAFLGACRIYSNPKLGELATNESLKLDPMDPFPHVLLSHIYAAVGKWDQASMIRKMMRKKGILKNPGRCWIAVNNKVHHFGAGDTSHEEARGIYATLNGLLEKLKTEGYCPDTRLVMRDIDEENKESALSHHSEKLALAYGLMHVTPGEPIQIYQNLRICSDCHTVMTLISKITGREIMNRDANRFHHFKEGLCSCGGYW